MSHINNRYTSEISIGDINYYIGDTISPTFSAPTGSVYIIKDDNTTENKTLFLNKGDNIWEKCIHGSYGKILGTNSTARNTTQNTWTALNVGNFSETLTSGEFEIDTVNNNNTLKYTGHTPVKTSVTLNVNIANTVNQMTFQTGVSRNLLTPFLYNGNTLPGGNNYNNIHSLDTYNLDTNEFITGGIRWVTADTGGPTSRLDYTPVYIHKEVYVIDSSIDIYKELWDDSSDWTIVNDTTNIWGVGTAQSNGSNGQSIYISDDNFATATYDVDTAQVSHFYREFEIPSDVHEVILGFDWKCWAEDGGSATSWDYGTVVIEDTAPTVGVESSTTLATLDNALRPSGNGRIGAITNDGKFNLAYGGANNDWKFERVNLTNYIGQNKKIIFTWKNDGSIGNDVPFVIDNIYLYIF